MSNAELEEKDSFLGPEKKVPAGKGWDISHFIVVHCYRAF